MVVAFDVLLATAVKLIAQRVNNVTTIGHLEPQWGLTERLRFYRAYEGIRYAHPPTGEYRFEAARPIDKFDRVVEHKVECMQIHPNTEQVIGDEDCLYLNVYVPGVTLLDQSLPVMIWLHGTQLAYGTNKMSLFNPMRFMDQWIIVVTLNYRVGFLGFGCLGKMKMQCNLGLKDQKVAINWVLKNIWKFGGNPKKVTLAGHGAGATHALIHLHDQFEGKINRGIALSGSRFAPWALPDRQKNIELTKIAIADCLGKQTPACLKNSDIEDIIMNSWAAMKDAGDWWYNVTVPYGPSVNGKFIKSYPSLTNSSGNFDLLLGLSLEQTSKSMSALFNRTVALDKDLVFNQFMEANYNVGIIDHSVEMRPGFETTVRSMYQYLSDPLPGISVDGWFLYPAIVEASQHAGHVQGLMFGHRGNPGCRDTEEILNRDELAFLFQIPGCSPTEEDRRISRKYVKVLGDFVKHGRVYLREYVEDKELFNFISSSFRNIGTYPPNMSSIGPRMQQWSQMGLTLRHGQITQNEKTNSARNKTS